MGIIMNGRGLVDRLLSISSKVSKEEWDKIPDDLAENYRKHKKLNEGIRRIRERSKAKGSRTGKLVKLDPEPRYNQVYEKGIIWLDTLDEINKPRNSF